MRSSVIVSSDNAQRVRAHRHPTEAVAGDVARAGERVAESTPQLGDLLPPSRRVRYGQRDRADDLVVEQVEQLVLARDVGVERRGPGAQLGATRRIDTASIPSARSTSSAVATIASRLSARRAAALRGVHHGGSTWDRIRHSHDEAYLTRTLFAVEHRSSTNTVRVEGTHGRSLIATAYRWRWLALVAVLAAEIMDLVDGTVVGIAAPSIRAELGGGDAMIQWVAAGYTLAFAAGLITGGRLGDLYGRRRMFLLGLIGFVAASALCGLATSPGMLIGFRVAQGLLGAMLIPQGFGILKATFPPDDLGKAFGAFGPTIGLAVVGAPILGGALIAWDVAGLGWRTIFLINVPLGLAALALAAAVLPESRAEDGPRPDPVGMVLVSTGLALLVFPLVEGRELGWPAWTFGMLAAGAGCSRVFAAHQVRRSRAGRAPLVEPALFRLRRSPRAWRWGWRCSRASPGSRWRWASTSSSGWATRRCRPGSRRRRGRWGSPRARRCRVRCWPPASAARGCRSARSWRRRGSAACC